MSVRVRFAPSPTGFLHIGGVRTALFNWLFARHEGGAFLVRIENTDQSREVEKSVEQSRARSPGSVSTGTRTWPSSSTGSSGIARSRRHWSQRTRPTRTRAVRLRAPDEGTTAWEDAVKGRIEVENKSVEDFVLLRSDGTPTYNFAAPVDDADSGITHVIRGEDHVSNTPKQILLLQAMGATAPVYAHVPNVFGTDGRKLSKRHGAVSVEEFRREGYIAPALMNYLALLGWSYDDKTTLFSRDELVRHFTLACRLEPGCLRLREAQADERRLPACAVRGRVRGHAARVSARAGHDCWTRSSSGAPCRSCRRRS